MEGATRRRRDEVRQGKVRQGKAGDRNEARLLHTQGEELLISQCEPTGVVAQKDWGERTACTRLPRSSQIRVLGGRWESRTRRLEGDLQQKRNAGAIWKVRLSTECALLVVWCGWVASFWDRESDGCCQLHRATDCWTDLLGRGRIVDSGWIAAE